MDDDETSSFPQCHLLPLPAKAALKQAQLISATMHRLGECDVARGKFRQNGISHIIVQFHAAKSLGLTTVGRWRRTFLTALSQITNWLKIRILKKFMPN